MAKEKTKHDGLLCFLLALIVVLILVIGGGAYYFLVVDNGEEIAEIGTQKQENKLINLSEAEKKEINKKIDNVYVYMTYMLDYVKSSDNNFTEKEMVEIAYSWAVKEDENFEQFIQATELGEQKVNIDYVEKWVKKVFNKTVNVENIEGLIIDGETVLLSWPNGIGPAVFKVQKLELNEATDTYSLYIDKLDLTWIGDRIEELKEITDYTNYKLENSYVLRYKELNGEKYIVDIVKNEEQNTNVENSTEGSVKLTAQEIEFFNEYFFISNYRVSAINGILTSDFTDARDIWLPDLLYTFAQAQPNNEDFDYKEYTGGVEVEEHGTIYKVTRKDFNDFLVKNTGYSLDEFSGYKILEDYSTMKYIKEYDAFYINPQGAWHFNTKCVSGEKIGNKYILNFESKVSDIKNNLNMEEYKSSMTLNKVGDNYIIVSNEKKIFTVEGFYIREDGTISYFNRNQKEYGYMIDKEGNKIVAKQVFSQNYWQDDELKNAGIYTRIIIVTKDNKLMYWDTEDKNYVAKLLSDELVSKLEIEKVKIDNDEERIDLIIKTKSGKEILKKGINDRYYFDSTKQIEL